MNKQIRLLIEKFSDLFNNDELGIFNTENVYDDLSNEIFYSYHPESKQELRTLIEELLKERGKNAFLNDIDVSNITDMTELFNGLDPHNIDIRYWDVSNVENMYCMFYKCENFDCNLSSWDVRNVEDMSYMFKDCTKFTGEGLNNWKPINCEDMQSMFKNCINFDCDFSGWDVSNVEDMTCMFDGCKKFIGQGLDEWKPIKCKYKGYIFDECSSLNSYPSWYKK